MAEYIAPCGRVVLYDDDVVLPGRLSVGDHGYAQCWHREFGEVFLFHRWVMGLFTGDGQIVDHVNRNRLDCHRSNLRLVTARENAMNRAALPIRPLPPGVYATRQGRYQAQFKLHGANHTVGTYDDPDTALAARTTALALMGA